MKEAIHFSAQKIILTAALLIAGTVFNNSFAAVAITEGSANVYPCPSFPTNYFDLGNIVITEQANADFGNGTGVTLILDVPANFEFEPGVGSVSRSGPNLSAASIAVTATQITVTITVSGATGGGFNPDQLTISGIRVRGITALTGSSPISRGGGTAVIAGAVVSGLTYGNITSLPFPSANAGTDQIICSTSSSFEAAALGLGISGTWTLESGAGTITTPGSPTSTVTGLALGDNTFRWTINGGGCSSSSLVTITRMSSGLGCTVASNQFSAVTAISPAPASQDIICPPSSTNITTFTLANPGPFNVGDKVLVIQMQGAIVNTTNAAVETAGFDGVFGSVIDYNGAGNYEYAIIASKTGSDVTFSQNLLNTYNVAGKVQLVTVPQFANYTLSGTLNGTPWNSATGTGGVLVFEVLGTLTINGGTINMDSRGFLGGGAAIYPGAPLSGAALNTGVWLDGTATARCGMGRYSAAVATPSTGLRGEGIAASSSHLYGRGALANGGGSGGGWNSGAGGGSNICPGGRGGYEYSSCHNNMGVNPYYVGVVPTYNAGNGSPAVNLPARMHGIGGYALDASGPRVFLGGGGGAANGDGNAATAGGNGGGIIIISAETIAGTGGTITANGQDGYKNCCGSSFYSSTVDATGGGGGGGSILLDVTTYSISTLNLFVNGGKGGNQNQANTCHGNGGGGSGGLIRTKGITPNVIISAAGGRAGIQRPDATEENSLPLSNDNACAGGTTYGATAGGSCAAAAQTALIVVPMKGCCSEANLGADQTLCGTGSILLLNGTASNTNKVFKWYKNGVLIPGETGPTYTATTVGLYTVVVDSVVGGFNYCSVTDAMLITNAFPTPYLGPDQQLCSPSYLNLAPSNVGSFPSGTTWTWTKDGAVISGETTPYLNNVTAAGTYTLTATTAVAGCGPTSASIALTTVLPVTVDACRGDNGELTLSVSGGNGGPYEWYANSTGGAPLTTGTSYTTPSLSSTTTYWVQDNGLYQTTIGPPLTGNGLPTPPGNRSSGSTDNQLVFDALEDFYLRGITVQYWANSCGGNVSYSINVSGSGYTTETRTGTAGPCGPGLQTYTITFATPIFIPAGTNYQISPSGSSHAFAFYTSGFTYNSTYSSMIKMIKNNSSASTAYPGFFDWQISYARNCSRVPVIASIDPSCSPLPVQFINFSALLQDNSAYLSWSTGSEKDNAYFNLQRSSDGVTFENIGKVNGNGTTHQIHYYYFTDQTLPSGTVYYRLAQADYDGKISYSKVISLNNDKTSVISLYPNPFNSGINLIVKNRLDYSINVRLSDMSGKVLHSNEYNSNQTILLGESLAEGVYIIEVRSEHETQTLRVIKINP